MAQKDEKMNRFGATMALAAAASTGFLCSLAPVPAVAAPIAVQQCFVIAPRALSHKPRGTQINYVNMSRKTATSVTFAVGYRNSLHNFVRRVTDVGSFAPGAVIRHSFPLYNDVTYAGKQTHGCAPVSISFADGRHWRASR